MCCKCLNSEDDNAHLDLLRCPNSEDDNIMSNSCWISAKPGRKIKIAPPLGYYNHKTQSVTLWLVREAWHMKSTKKETMRPLPLGHYIQLTQSVTLWQVREAWHRNSTKKETTRPLPLGHYIQLTHSVTLRGLAHEMHTGKPQRHFHWDTTHN